MFNSTNLPLEKKKIIKKTLESLPLGIYIFAFSIFVIKLASAEDINLNVNQLLIFAICFFIAYVVMSYFYNLLYYKAYFYDFLDDKAKISKGVLSKSTGFVKYEKIQNIYIDQDFLDRIFGLFDVHYETAGENSNIYSHVDGLNEKNADKLTDFLNEKVKGNSSNNQPSVIAKHLDDELMQNDADVSGTSVIDRTIVKVSKMIVLKKFLSTLFTFLFFALLMYFVFPFMFMEYNMENSVQITVYKIFLIAIIPVILLALIYFYIWYKNFDFKFSEKSGFISSKVISLSNSYIYYDRIQNININQSVLDRLFGLFSVTIETAREASDDRGLIIPGLLKSDAEKIKVFLLAKMEKNKNKL